MASPDENQQEKKDPTSKPFLEHLEDLRQTLLRCVSVILLGMCIAGPFAPTIIGLIKRPLELAVLQRNEYVTMPAVEPDGSVSTNSVPARRLKTSEDYIQSDLMVTGGFGLVMRVALWGGLFLSAPLVIFFIGAFIFPGLYEKERKVVLQSSGYATGLFFGGAALGYFYCLPVALRVMIDINSWIGVPTQWTISNLIAFNLQLLLAFGLVFEMPIVLVSLGKLGLVSSAFLRKYRRHAVVVMLIVAMIATPSSDVFSQLIMGGPLIILYEVCIWMIWSMERKREKQLA